MAESSSGVMWKCANPTCPMQVPLAIGKLFMVCPVCQTACNSAANPEPRPTAQQLAIGAETAALSKTPTDKQSKVAEAEQLKQKQDHEHQNDQDTDPTPTRNGNLPKEDSHHSPTLTTATNEASSLTGQSGSTPSKQQVSLHEKVG